MPKALSHEERIEKARALIQKARELPVPGQAEGGKLNFSYIAQVKATLADARDLVKFLPQTAGVTEETKSEVEALFEEIKVAEGEILR
jgi:hypothetical protein